MSVVVPTYNRSTVLHNTLASVARQTAAPGPIEVIVVDDGSTQALAPAFLGQFSLPLRCLRQDNAGATRARNAGAAAATGDLLVFVDDDISLEPEALAELSAALCAEPRTIVLGTLVTPEPLRNSVFSRLHSDAAPGPEAPATVAVDFRACLTGLLAVRRSDFEALGGFDDPGGGWPNWDDVEFGYRAHLAGFRFVRSQRAVGQHWDYALKDLGTAARRWQAAGRAAVRLFQKHPELRLQLPMFADKTPVNWGSDTPRLLARKLARQLASSRPVLWLMERLAVVLERYFARPRLLRPLYRWVIGGYIYRGYRQGLKEFT